MYLIENESPIWINDLDGEQKSMSMPMKQKSFYLKGSMLLASNLLVLDHETLKL